MTKNPIFRGAATALITPLCETGVDYDAFGRLIDWQIDSGIDGLVIAGTTGEASTLTDEEHREVLRFAIDRIAGRVPAVAGTGSNDTAYAIDMTRFACEIGYDAVLVVTPYYNKATQKGLINHYVAVAEASEKPVILYSVPGRTGCKIMPDTAAVLSQHPNIVGFKDANGDMDSTVETIAKCGENLHIYSGEDSLTVPMMAMGAMGCISVLSNVVPHLAVEMCDKFFAGDVAGAAALQCKMLPLIRALFSEVNPIPAKAAVAAMGFGQEYLRMPLSCLEDHNRENLFKQMRALGVKI